jgi:hypothetical protein
MITSAIFLLACPLSQAPVTLPTTEPVFVEITKGYGTLLAGETTTSLRGEDGEQWVEGRGHLSLMATGAATLRWHGRASLELSGPCEVEWKPYEANGELKWSFQHVTTAMIETRRAPLSITLGTDWNVSIPPGAFTLRGLAKGEFEILQQAGAPAIYQWEGSKEYTRPAQRGLIGRPVRLGPRPRASREDQSAHLDGRLEWAWPWREEAQDVASWGYRDWPWVAGRPQPVTVHVDRTPAPTQVVTPLKEIEVTVKPTPVVADPLPAPVQVVVEETAPAPEEAVEVPADPEPNPDGDGTWGWESDESKAAGPWRGFSEESFRPFGEYHIQNRTGILSEELADGGIRFWIPESYKAAGWVLGTRLDTRLTPGGSIEFGPTGALRQHSGGVRVLAALER